MKILHLGKYYPPYFGGIENVTYELVTGLNEFGVRCDVLCSNDQYRFQRSNESGYDIVRVKQWINLFSTSIAPQYIFEFGRIHRGYDVVSVHLPNPLACLALFLVRPRARIVVHWHSDIIKQRFLSFLLRPLEKWTLNRADLVIGATENHILGSDLRRLMENKCETLPYPIDVKNLHSNVDYALLEKLQIRYPNKKIIFSVGRLVYYKGFQYLIEAAKHLPEDCVILIAGIGPEHGLLQGLISKNNLRHRVVLLGKIPIESLGSYFTFCDVFCLPSIHRSEMFGVVQLEAMSFGKPVVSTKLDRSGVPIVNSDDVTGLTVPVKDSVALSKALIDVLFDRVKYERFSKAAVERVNTLYNKGAIINRLIDLYRY